MRLTRSFLLVVLAVGRTAWAASPSVAVKESFPYQLLDGGPLPQGAFLVPLPGRNTALIDPVGIGALDGVQAAVIRFAGPDAGQVVELLPGLAQIIVSATPVQELGGPSVYWLGSLSGWLRWDPSTTQVLGTGLSANEAAAVVDGTGNLRMMPWVLTPVPGVELESLSAAPAGGYATEVLSTLAVNPGSDFSRLYHVSGTGQVYSLALGSNNAAYLGDFTRPDAGMVDAGTYPDFDVAGLYDSPSAPYLVTVSGGSIQVTGLAPTGLVDEGSFKAVFGDGSCACSIGGVFPLHAAFDGYPEGALVLTHVDTPSGQVVAVIDWGDVAALLGLGIDADAGPIGSVDALVPPSGGSADGGGSGGGGGGGPGGTPSPFVQPGASSGCSAAAQASAGGWTLCGLALGLAARRRRTEGRERPGPPQAPRAFRSESGTRTFSWVE